LVIQSNKVGVIVPAGGVGERIGTEIPKQYIEIQGKPILIHTIEKFERCDSIDEIVLVCGKRYIEKVHKDIQNYDIQKITQVVQGESIRQGSVANGLKALSHSVEIVLVHDAVRPFISTERIKEVIQAVKKHGAAFLALREKNTVWQVMDGWVKENLNREMIWEAQTPQGFRVDWLREAHQKAKEDRYIGTDEVSLVKRLGYRVRVIEGDDKNIKITSPRDLFIARLIFGEKE